MSVSTNPYGVRRATPDDYDELLRQAIYLAREDAVQPVSDERVAEWVARCVNQDNALAGVMDDPKTGEFWGSVGLAFDRHPFCDDDHLTVLWLGTSQTYRSLVKSKHGTFPREHAGIAKRLVVFAKWASEGLGMPLFIRLLTLKELEKKMHSYTREIKQVGATFCWGVPEEPARQFFDQISIVPVDDALAAYHHEPG